MDKMHINGLSFRCIIGTRPAERRRAQRVMIDVTLDCDLRRAGKTDNLTDTVNYNKLAEKIGSLVCASRFLLIERLAEAVAGVCLDDSRVKCVGVIVTKPGALDMAHSASVEIFRRCGKT